ncbi:hypothetical protein C8J57DRAFT_1474831 [Mycena rebaudengoi]|nr:hypothetical protein C8J57DRAFT_1474831 [Mycena rebaudengoi]
MIIKETTAARTGRTTRKYFPPPATASRVVYQMVKRWPEHVQTVGRDVRTAGWHMINGTEFIYFHRLSERAKIRYGGRTEDPSGSVEPRATRLQIRSHTTRMRLQPPPQRDRITCWEGHEPGSRSSLPRRRREPVDWRINSQSEASAPELALVRQATSAASGGQNQSEIGTVTVRPEVNSPFTTSGLYARRQEGREVELGEEEANIRGYDAP